MVRTVVVAALCVAACGTEYDRPLSVEYITEAVLAPSCAVAQCHSSFRRAEGYSFGTVAEARESLVGLVVVDDLEAGDPGNSLLVTVLERTVDRMPYDQALPAANIELIRDWVANGAKGAQCSPEIGDAQCLNDILYACGDDYTFGAVIEDCTQRTPSAGMKSVCRGTACTEVAQ